MKKIFWLIPVLFTSLVLILWFCLYTTNYRYIFMDGSPYPVISLKVHPEGNNGINAWDDNSQGIIHYFLPCESNVTSITLKNSSSVSLMIDSKSNSFFTVEEDKNYVLSYGENVFDVQFHFIPNISSVFISTNSKSMENINNDKEYTETGTIISINPSGTKECQSKIESIKGHGNGTWFFDKKPYSIELKDRAFIGDLKNVKDLTLLALRYDGDKIHSKLGLELGALLGQDITIKSTYINLYLNGNYMGLYLAAESPKKKQELKQSTFLVEKDFLERCDEGRFVNIPRGDYFSILRPKHFSENTLFELSDTLNKVDSEMRSSVYNSIDLKSFAIHYLVDELSLNYDSLITSAYFYSPANNNKLYAGPEWDYDGAFGAYLHMGDRCVNLKKSVIGPYEDQLDWYYLLSQSNEFSTEVKNLLASKKSDLEVLFSVGIDRQSFLIEKASYCDDLRWKYITEDWYGSKAYLERKNAVRYLKYFCEYRLNEVCSWYGINDTSCNINWNDSIHTVKFMVNGEEMYSMSVNDGDTLNISDFPMLENDAWAFSFSGALYNENIPILEDC